MFFRRLLAFIRFLIIPVIIFFVVTAIVLAVALGIGWVLQLLVPFDWFQATLLSLIAGLAIIAFLISILKDPPVSDDADDFDDYDIVDEWRFSGDSEDEIAIPLTRFWTSSRRPSWEAWMTFVLANDIYVDLLEDDKISRRWDDKSLEDVAIDLAKAAIENLKRRAPQKKVAISKTKLRESLKKTERWAEYHPFIDLFHPIINNNLYLWEDTIRDVKASGLWRETIDPAMLV